MQTLVGVREVPVMCRPELEELDGGRLLLVGLRLGRRCTRGGGGGLKEGGDSVDPISS